MASADGISNEYAPGVVMEGEYHHAIWYSGRAEALVSCGMVNKKWLPGEPGNGKGSQQVVFSADGEATLLPPRSRFDRCNTGHGGLSIHKVGNRFRVCRHMTKTEVEARQKQEESAQMKGTWLAAKKVAEQPDLVAQWKNGVMHHINEVDQLLSGQMVFSEMPDIVLSQGDVNAAKEAIAGLRRILSASSPYIKSKVTVSGNVFALNEKAFRHMNVG